MTTPLNQTGEPTATLVADRLRESIITGEISPGSRLRQADLAQQYETSRIPVREALRTLESDGLVTIVANTGAWVSSLSFSEFQETYKLRHLIEPFALEQSIPNLAKHDKEKIFTLCRHIENLLHEPVNIQEFLRLDRAFHLSTYAGLQNDYLHSIVQRLWNSTQQYRRALITTLSFPEILATHENHKQIVNAIRRGDSASAGKLVWVHIQRTIHRIENQPALLL